jgi:hypothetical protein
MRIGLDTQSLQTGLLSNTVNAALEPGTTGDGFVFLKLEAEFAQAGLHLGALSTSLGLESL